MENVKDMESRKRKNAERKRKNTASGKETETRQVEKKGKTTHTQREIVQERTRTSNNEPGNIVLAQKTKADPKTRSTSCTRSQATAITQA